MSMPAMKKKLKGTSEQQRRLVADMSRQFKVLLEARRSIIYAYQGDEQAQHLSELYESSITPLYEAFLELGFLIAPKQAGGRPVHGRTGIALILQQARYAANGTFYKAKELAKVVNDYAADPARSEFKWEQLAFKYAKRTATQAPMSEKIARDTIQTFKATIKSSDI
jgi:hypothetical protein